MADLTLPLRQSPPGPGPLDHEFPLVFRDRREDAEEKLSIGGSSIDVIPHRDELLPLAILVRNGQLLSLWPYPVPLVTLLQPAAKARAITPRSVGLGGSHRIYGCDGPAQRW